jgi:uncharacterized protein
VPPSIPLASGVLLDFREPDCCPWSIDDIARGLAYTARFRGQTPSFYSVAQHSVMMSREAPPEVAAAALFHDAAEAFMGDMPTPLKTLLPEFRRMELVVQASILRRLGLPPTLPPMIKHLDRRMLATEVRDLLSGRREGVSGMSEEEPFDCKVVPWGPKRAHWEFHKRSVEVLGLKLYRATNSDSRARRKRRAAKEAEC